MLSSVLPIAFALLLVLTDDSQAASRFASAPHILAFSSRQQVVLFTKGEAAGAMATRRSDGTYDVVVPDARLEDPLRGRDFFGRPVDGGGAGTAVSLSETADGDVRIHVRPAGNVARVVAVSVSDPPRLRIDLLSADAAEVEGATSGDAKKATRQGNLQKAEAPAAPAGLKPSEVPSGEAHQAKSDPVPAPTPVRVAAPAGETDEVREEPPEPTSDDTKSGPRVRVDDEPARAEGPTLPGPEPFGPELCRAPVADAPVAEAHEIQDLAAPLPTELGRLVAAREPVTDSDDLHCRFRRVFGVPFCAAAATDPGYRDDPYASGLALRIAAGATWLAPVQMPPDSEVGPFLSADREFIVHAEKRWLLPAVAAYERATRLRPSFSGAPRAHMNVALIYATLGFGPELEIEAQDGTNPARDFARAVLGDVRRAQGRVGEASALYEQATQGGPLAACFAARGLAALALLEENVERAQMGVEALAELCPPEIVLDWETERVRARTRLAVGDVDGALSGLAAAARRSSRYEQVEIARERAHIAEASGRLDEARGVWAEFKTGVHGEAAATEGVLGLARLGGSSEAIEEGLARADGLPRSERDRVRKELFVGVSGAAMAEGDELAAFSMILSEGVDERQFDVPAQIALARAYRRLGLVRESADVLERILADSGPVVPDAYWEERTRVALVTGDLTGAAGALDRWRTARGGNPSAAELSLRARLLAERAAPVDEIGTLLRRLDALDAARGRSARWEIAAEYARSDPAGGIQLLEEETGFGALDELPDQRVSETLWTLGRAAETEGKTAAALLAYRALAAHLPATARGADAAYRAGRLLEKENDPGGATRAYRAAATHPDELDRRLADAAAGFQQVVEPWTRRQEEQ